MKRFTKLLTLILVIALLLTLCPFTTIAAEGSSVSPSAADTAAAARENAGNQADKNGAMADEPATGGGDVVDFSENNLLMSTFHSSAPYGYSGVVGAGGTVNMAAAYFARWGGPISESSDPYYNYKLVTGYSPITQISDVLMIPHTDYNNSSDIAAIKQAVYDYGAAYLSMQYLDSFMNKTTAAYYLPPSETLLANYGHAVTVVGWDDNYAASNFLEGKQPSANGAFIIKNSHGTGGALGGYFYLSYYDKCVGKPIEINGEEYANNTAVFVTGQANAESYDHNYQYDPYGHTANFALATSPEYYYMANVFTATSAQTLKAISFYTKTQNVAFQVHIVKLDATEDIPAPGSLPAASASGLQAYAGYHTVALNTGVPLASGQRFAVVVRIPGSGSGDYPVCYEEKTDTQLKVTTGSGQSFLYGPSSQKWLDFYGHYGHGNLCIKAFTIDGTTGTAEEPVAIGESTTTPGESVSVPGDSATISGEGSPAPGESDTAGKDSAPALGESETVPGESTPAPGESEAIPGNSTTGEPVTDSLLDSGKTIVQEVLLPSTDDTPPTGTADDEEIPGVLLERVNLYSNDGSEPTTGGTPPASYDLRKTGEVTSVKNQGSVGACWTFAAMASAESTYMRSKKSFVGNVTLSKNTDYLKNTNTTGITITATALRSEDVLTYEWDITKGEGTLISITGGSSTCLVKPVANAEGIAQVRCIVTYTNSALPIAVADINIVVGNYGTGDGTSSKPYIVDSPADLQLLGGFAGSEYRGKYFKQTTDIDLSGISNWEPISTYYIGYAFEGNYDGCGYTISNLTINAAQSISENTGLGLFSCIENGTIRDVTLTNCSITVSAPQSDGNYIIGGLAARADNATVEDCYVTGSVKVTLTGAMTTYVYSGGLIGYALGTNLSRCSFMGDITQTGGAYSNTGGLLSYANTGTINESFAITTLATKGQTGGKLTSQSGFVDELQQVVVNNSYAVSTITAANLPSTSCGAGMTTVPGSCHFTNCYASAKISGPATKGAFFGYYGNDTLLSNCYYNLTTKNNMSLNALGSAAGCLTGLSAQAMQTTASYIGWDFAGRWAISPLQNGGFPIHSNPIIGLDYLLLSSDMPSRIYRSTKIPLSLELFPSYAPPQAITATFDPVGAFTLDGSGILVPGTDYRGEVTIDFTHPGGSTGGASLILDDKKADLDKNGTVDTATAITKLLSFLTGKTTLDDYYLYDIDRSSPDDYSALSSDVTLTDLLTLKQYQAGLREINS